MKIKNIDLTRMRGGEHLLFMDFVVKRAEKLERLLEFEQGRLAVEELSSALKIQNSFLALSRKSLTTDDIKEADDLRDQMLRGCKSYIKSFLYFENDKSLAAKRIMQLFKDYNIDPQKSLYEQSGAMKSMIAQLQSSHAGDVEQLNFTNYIDMMKNVNDRVDALMTQRITESRAKTGAFRSARKRTDAAYCRLVDVTNAIATLYGDGGVVDFINFVNTLVKSHKRPTRQKGKPDSPEDTND